MNMLLFNFSFPPLNLYFQIIHVFVYSIKFCMLMIPVNFVF